MNIYNLFQNLKKNCLYYHVTRDANDYRYLMKLIKKYQVNGDYYVYGQFSDAFGNTKIKRHVKVTEDFINSYMELTDKDNLVKEID